MFLASFHVKDYIFTLLESAGDYTDRYDELLFFLRGRIFRVNNLNTTDAIVSANITQSDLSTIDFSQM